MKRVLTYIGLHFPNYIYQRKRIKQPTEKEDLGWAAYIQSPTNKSGRLDNGHICDFYICLDAGVKRGRMQGRGYVKQTKKSLSQNMAIHISHDPKMAKQKN